MDYLARDKDGNVLGPVDQETLLKWVELDKIFSDTPVRNAIMANWKEAREIDFLKAALEAQSLRLDAEIEANKGFFDRTLELLGMGGEALIKKKLEKEKSTAFKYEYLPNPAKPSLRFMAALFDWSLIAAFVLILFFTGVAIVCVDAHSTTARNTEATAEMKKEQEAAKKAQEKAAAPRAEAPTIAANTPPQEPEAPPQIPTVAESFPPGSKDDEMAGCRLGTLWTDTSSGTVYACLRGQAGNALWCERARMNSLFSRLFCVFSVVVLLYFGLSLGLFSQTVGMWYWGIFIVKPDLGEALMFRSYLFGILGIFLGFLVPFFASVHPKRRSLHDQLCGVWVVGIAAKPKA